MEEEREQLRRERDEFETERAAFELQRQQQQLSELGNEGDVVQQMRHLQVVLESQQQQIEELRREAPGNEMVDIRSILGAHELTDKKAGLSRALVGEFVGTMLLNFFGCGAVVTGNVVAISLAFGLTVAAAIQVIGHVSGGHVNPAVTVGLAVIGKIPLVRALLYIIAQSIGAITGSAVVRALSPPYTDEERIKFLGVVSLAPGIEPAQGVGIEFFLALILVLVVCGACDAAKPESKGIAPLIIGLTVTVGHIVGVPRTGSGMNPARALGSSVVMGMFANHWIYWIGPILGGMAGGLLYKHAIGAAKEPELPKSYNPVATEEKELQRLTGDKGTHPA